MDLINDVKDFVKPAKAKLVVVENQADRDQELECMFNPSEYRLSQRVDVRPLDVASETKDPQYIATSAMILTMQLFFDDFASAQGDVTPKISTLLAWQRPTIKSDKRPRPPLLRFVWGNKQLSTFRGVLTAVEVQYTVFRRDGTPIQAKVDITIEGKEEVVARGNPTSHAVDSRRVHTMTAGDSLQSVAYRQLGNATYWRAIAELNGIDDPLRVAPGQVLLIPTVVDVARGT